jgi:hypothetical protein
MQKKEYTLGGGGEALGEGALGPGAADGTLGLFLLSAGRPGRHFTGADNEATAAAIVALFLLPRGRPWPLFPPGRQCSDAIHLHRPWSQVLERRNPI